jgi:hypothetical protein
LRIKEQETRLTLHELDDDEQSTRLRFPEDDADALKHVGVISVYKI